MSFPAGWKTPHCTTYKNPVILLLFTLYISVGNDLGQTSTCYTGHVEVRGQHVGIGFLLPPYTF